MEMTDEDLRRKTRLEAELGKASVAECEAELYSQAAKKAWEDKIQASKKASIALRNFHIALQRREQRTVVPHPNDKMPPYLRQILDSPPDLGQRPPGARRAGDDGTARDL